MRPASRGVGPWRAECGLSELYSQLQRLARICTSGAVLKNSVLKNSVLKNSSLHPQGLPPVVEHENVDAELCCVLSHALPVRRTHPPSHVSFDDLTVTTHWSCPQAPGVLIRGVATFLKSGLIGSIGQAPNQVTLFTCWSAPSAQDDTSVEEHTRGKVQPSQARAAGVTR